MNRHESGCSDDTIARVLQHILSYRLLRKACPLKWWHKVQRLLLTLICTHMMRAAATLCCTDTHTMSQMRFEPEQERYVDSVCMLALACMRTCLYIFMFIGSVCMCASVSVPRLCACVYAAPVFYVDVCVCLCWCICVCVLGENKALKITCVHTYTHRHANECKHVAIYVIQCM